jgi:hypothetical protein
MDLEERQGFMQAEFMALNVIEMEKRADDNHEEVQADFGQDNE